LPVCERVTGTLDEALDAEDMLDELNELETLEVLVELDELVEDAATELPAEAAVLDEPELAVVLPPALPPPPQADSRAMTASAARLFLTSIFISTSQRSPLGFGDPGYRV